MASLISLHTEPQVKVVTRERRLEVARWIGTVVQKTRIPINFRSR